MWRATETTEKRKVSESKRCRLQSDLHAASSAAKPPFLLGFKHRANFSIGVQQRFTILNVNVGDQSG